MVSLLIKNIVFCENKYFCILYIKMPRCCVPNCDSGTFREVKRTRAAGLRVKSFFMFPKNEELLKKWKEIIFHNKGEIIDKLKICELHFNESDIIKYDETLLKDGTIHRIQRQRYILRYGAIPTLSNTDKKEYINESRDNAQANNNSEVSIFKNQIVDLIQNESKTLRNQEQEILCMNDSKQIEHVTPKNTFILKSHQIKNQNLEFYKSNNEEDEVTSSTNHFIVIDIGKKKIQFKKEVHDVHVPINQYENNMVHSFQQEIDSQNINVEEVQGNTNILVEKINKENNNDKYKNCTQDYNFFQLKKDLKTKSLNISSSWSYAFQENSSVTFAYVHPLKFIIQLFCIIDCNMNVKIATFDKRVNLDVNIKLSSSVDFLNYLLKLEKTKCCDGTGIKNIYSKKCQGFISSTEEYKRSRGYQRCSFCREFRRIILRRENNPVDIELRMREQNRKIKTLQYKYAQLQKIIKERTRKIQLNSSKIHITAYSRGSLLFDRILLKLEYLRKKNFE